MADRDRTDSSNAWAPPADYPSPCRLSWPIQIAIPEGAPVLAGHTDTVPDVIGRIDGRAALTIFTEGNHFPVLLPLALSGFRQWAKTHATHLDLANIVLVTLPQRMILAALENRNLALGNLLLPVERGGVLFPDLVMGGVAALRRLHRAGIIVDEARLFARNRGIGLLVRAGNPLGIRSIRDLLRPDVKIVTVTPAETAARELYVEALERLLGRARIDDVLARTIDDFPGRLGVQHRDIPAAVAENRAAVGVVFHHLALYYARTFPDLFDLVPVAGAEELGAAIHVAPVREAQNKAALAAFLDYFLSASSSAYPEGGFMPLPSDHVGRKVALH